jgi:hypothetical protein
MPNREKCRVPCDDVIVEVTSEQKPGGHRSGAEITGGLARFP